MLYEQPLSSSEQLCFVLIVLLMRRRSRRFSREADSGVYTFRCNAKLASSRMNSYAYADILQAAQIDHFKL